MRFQIDVHLNYAFLEATTAFLTVEAAFAPGQYVEYATLDLGMEQSNPISGDAGLGVRRWVQLCAPQLMVNYMATVDVTRADPDLLALHAVPLHNLPADVAPYLRPSRYCQSDKFLSFVRKRFGHLSGGAKVAAIRDWIEQNLSYVPGASDADTNVLETFASREGVCRDYAHLLCTMVRAARIPARMVAAYSPYVTPMDFHAVAEVWLDGAWHLVDATGMCRASDLAIIAVGRDAYDIAFLDTEAPADCLYQSVNVRFL